MKHIEFNQFKNAVARLIELYTKKSTAGVLTVIAVVLLTSMFTFIIITNECKYVIYPASSSTTGKYTTVSITSNKYQTTNINPTTTSSTPLTNTTSTQNKTITTKALKKEIDINDIKSSILLKTTGCSYSYSESNHDLSFSYDNGKVNIDFPLEWASKIFEGIGTSCWCVSTDKTAVVCIQNNTIVIVYSDDRGKTWNISSPIVSSLFPTHAESVGENPDVNKVIGNIKINFSSKNCGYLIICGGLDSGYENNHDLFKTDDGGKTWNFIDSNFPAQTNPITDMHFIDNKTGYICDSCEYALESDVWRTSDGGVTWTSIKLPLTTDSDITGKYGAPTCTFAPYFINSKGYILVYSTKYNNDPDIFIYFVSSDNGKTWTYGSTKYNLTGNF